MRIGPVKRFESFLISLRWSSRIIYPVDKTNIILLYFPPKQLYSLV